MTDERCETCEWWRPLPGRARGDCALIGMLGRGAAAQVSPLAQVRSLTGGPAGLVTGAAFGCIEHSPRVER